MRDEFDKFRDLGYNVAHKEDSNMTENAVVRARISGKVKEEAGAVLAAMGLTVSDAFRMMMTRVAAEKKLPFMFLLQKKFTMIPPNLSTTFQILT